MYLIWSQQELIHSLDHSTNTYGEPLVIRHFSRHQGYKSNGTWPLPIGAPRPKAETLTLCQAGCHGWLFGGGNLELSFNDATKRDVKGWSWDTVAVFHAQKECVCRHRDLKHWHFRGNINGSMWPRPRLWDRLWWGRAFWRPRCYNRSEHNNETL